MSTSLEALWRHRAIHADDPESRRVWLFHSHAYCDHGAPERIAEARSFIDLVIRTFAGDGSPRGPWLHTISCRDAPARQLPSVVHA